MTTVEPEALGKVDMTPQQHGQIVSGLVGVTQSGEGTAAASWRGEPPPRPMAGKTGTAQVRARPTPPCSRVGPDRTRRGASVRHQRGGAGGRLRWRRGRPACVRILQPLSHGQLTPACTVVDRSACDMAALTPQPGQPVRRGDPRTRLMTRTSLPVGRPVPLHRPDRAVASRRHRAARRRRWSVTGTDDYSAATSPAAPGTWSARACSS